MARRVHVPLPAGEQGTAPLTIITWKGHHFMRAPNPAEDREPRASRVVAEALVCRQGPLRIVTRATRLGLSPTLTCAVVVACGASALDADTFTAAASADRESAPWSGVGIR